MYSSLIFYILKWIVNRKRLYLSVIQDLYNGSAIKVTKYQVYVPFSSWQDGQEVTFVINHVITDEDINY